ncbi:MAG: hypothetical protein IPP78_14060 [Holophagaceae bacterium]|nr:hypothetical protein [Holophagaceae bacterium]
MPMIPLAMPPAVVTPIGASMSSEGVKQTAFFKELEQWRKTRHDSLSRENGWLTLVGLSWLAEGENPFGSDPSNAVPLPQKKAPAKAGLFVLEHGVVKVKAAPGSGVNLNGKSVEADVDQALKSDAEGKPDVLTLGDLSFYVIKRGDRFGIRVKDSNSPVRLNFKGIASYPANPTFRVDAQFVPYEKPKDVQIPYGAGHHGDHAGSGLRQI